MDWSAFLTPTIGATGLLALVVILILRGSLIPRRNVEDLIKDKDRQIETWRAAYENGQKTQEVQRQQISALLDATRTTTHVLEALPRAAGLNERSRHALAPAPEEQ